MTRRSIVRTGTTAAWSVPVISVLAAAPAHAASPTQSPAALSVTVTATRSNSTGVVTVSGTINNTGGTTQSLQLKLEIQPAQPKSKSFGASTSGAMTGWGDPVITTVGQGRSFVYSSNSQLGRTSVNFSVQLTLAPDNAAGTLTATALSTGGTPGTASTGF